MSDHFHINITWAKEQARTIILSRKKIRLGLIIWVILSCTGVVGTVLAVLFFMENHDLNSQVASMNLRLIETSLESRDYADRVDNLRLQNTNLLSQNTDLLSQNDTDTQATPFSAEKEALVNKTLAEFNERNQLIENMMKNLGVKIKERKGSPNSGGPFFPSSDKMGEELLLRTDKNLEILRRTPLGRPIVGAITSTFGFRQDPINGRPAFHSGIDMQADYGDKVVATADGLVIQVGYNGDYGNYIEIKHGNGFTTGFAHLQSYKVKVGDTIKRGQSIGLAGNTGRSTGVHLHYEVRLNSQPINPFPFMQTAELYKEADKELAQELKKEQKSGGVASSVTPAIKEPSSTTQKKIIDSIATKKTIEENRATSTSVAFKIRKKGSSAASTAH
jgi:murein DD-endopeptidase MepM/ murein hydrolase activator NlpD